MISHDPRPISECYVTARLYGGTYIAKVDKSKATASCTSDIESAARRAAGKHLRVREDRVVLRMIPTNTRVGRARFCATIEPVGPALAAVPSGGAS